MSDHIRRFLDLTRPELFPLQGTAPTPEEFVKRLGRYNQYTSDLEIIVSLLARWSGKEQLPLLQKVFGHIGESEKGDSGYQFWIALSWYPCLLLMYAGGIAALSADRYDALVTILTTRIQRDPHSGKVDSPLLLPIVSESGKMNDGFKWLPGHERHYTPRSEYLFKELQPPLEDLLFLGRRYEALFDRFEMFLALVHVDLSNVAWGPVGRFGWKHSSPVSGGSPYDALIAEAEREDASWGPLRAGLFHGKVDRFLEAAKGYRERLNKLGWW